MPKVSVVIPVYGAETYIERCVRSLFEQTLDDIEYVFIDDCTPDGSLAILEDTLKEYPSRHAQVRIIRLDKNCGQAVGRAVGMEAATGEYTISCDSDDWVESDMYEVMYNEAKKNDADVVVCDVVYHRKNDETEYVNLGDYATPQDMLTCGQYIRLWSMCDKMVRTALIHEHKPYAVAGQNMWEDVCSSMLVMHYAKSLVRVHQPFYHYDMTRGNTTAQSPASIAKIKAQVANIQEVFRRFCEEGFDMGDTGMIYKRYVKDQLLNFRPIPFRLWSDTFPEVADYVDKDEHCSWLYKICYRLANKGFYWPFKMQMRLWELRNR